MTVVAATTAPGRPGKWTLFPDQVEVVSRLARHLRRPGTRALFVAATGTGKTLVSIRVADELRARLVLFVVPTLDLAAQSALAWRRDGHHEHMVIVSSMDASGRDSLVAARVMSSTDPVALAGLMSVVGEGEDQIRALTVICTYDSLDKIQETRNTAYAVPPFDLAIMDEAHRIAGRPDKKWAAVHDNQRIRADRRLYMTATPRIFAAPELAESADTTRPRRRTPTTRGPAAELFTNSMDNEQVYGKKVFEYPLAQAIEDGRAPDYRIVAPTIFDTDLRSRINLPTSDPDGEGEGPDRALRTTALHLAVLRAMRNHDLKKVLVYFNLVSDARLFARELPHTLRQLTATDPGLTPATPPELLFVHGEDTLQQHEDTFTRFAHAHTAILTNSRLIAEGVDIPSVDAIVFADPTRSVIRCVQALGRALRQNPHQTPRGPTPHRSSSLDRRSLRRRLVRPERHPGRSDVTTHTPRPRTQHPKPGGPPAHMNCCHPVLRSWEHEAQRHRLALASGNTPGRPVADVRRTAAPAPGPPTHSAALQNPLDHAHWTLVNIDAGVP